MQESNRIIYSLNTFDTDIAQTQVETKSIFHLLIIQSKYISREVFSMREVKS